nr:MAG: Nucleotide modification associated domain 5 [Bacteriophage sp.]
MNYKLINNKIMNITKAIAEEIADQMIKPMVDHQIAQETKMKEYCTLIILGNVPVSIQKEYKAHKEYFQHLSNAYLCNGNAQIYVSVEPFKVPLNNRSYRYECTKEQYDYIVKMEKDEQPDRWDYWYQVGDLVNAFESLEELEGLIKNFKKKFSSKEWKVKIIRNY